MNNTNLYMCNLPNVADEHTLKEVFQDHGIITSIRIFAERGFGFVQYSSQEAADGKRAAWL